MSLISCNLVTEAFKNLLGDPSRQVLFIGPPVPASRPRVTRWGTYYQKTYSDWKKKFEAEIKEFKETIDSPCTVIVETIGLKARTSKLFFPRGDVDNYAKSPLDILTKKKFWKDDDLVVNLFTSKRFASPDEEPRIEVLVYVHETK